MEIYEELGLIQVEPLLTLWWGGFSLPKKYFINVLKTLDKSFALH